MGKKIVLNGKVSIDVLSNILDDIKEQVASEASVTLDFSSVSGIDTAGMQMLLVLAREAVLGRLDLTIEGQVPKEVANKLIGLGLGNGSISDGNSLKTALINFVGQKN